MHCIAEVRGLATIAMQQQPYVLRIIHGARKADEPAIMHPVREAPILRVMRGIEHHPAYQRLATKNRHGAEYENREGSFAHFREVHCGTDSPGVTGHSQPM